MTKNGRRILYILLLRSLLAKFVLFFVDKKCIEKEIDFSSEILLYLSSTMWFMVDVRGKVFRGKKYSRSLFLANIFTILSTPKIVFSSFLKGGRGGCIWKTKNLRSFDWNFRADESCILHFRRIIVFLDGYLTVCPNIVEKIAANKNAHQWNYVYSLFFREFPFAKMRNFSALCTLKKGEARENYFNLLVFTSSCNFPTLFKQCEGSKFFSLAYKYEKHKVCEIVALFIHVYS